MDRREFLVAAGRVVVILPAGYAFAGCSSSSSSPYAPVDGGAAGHAGSADGGVLVFTSSLVSGHTHDFELSVAALASPPAGGLSAPTSINAGHSHVVALSVPQLQSIQGGASLTVSTSTASGHAHTFTFHK